MEKRNKS